MRIIRGAAVLDKLLYGAAGGSKSAALYSIILVHCSYVIKTQKKKNHNQKKSKIKAPILIQISFLPGKFRKEEMISATYDSRIKQTEEET